MLTLVKTKGILSMAYVGDPLVLVIALLENGFSIQ
jgi:hypothetical protein